MLLAVNDWSINTHMPIPSVILSRHRGISGHTGVRMDFWQYDPLLLDGVDGKTAIKYALNRRVGVSIVRRAVVRHTTIRHDHNGIGMQGH